MPFHPLTAVFFLPSHFIPFFCFNLWKAWEVGGARSGSGDAGAGATPPPPPPPPGGGGPAAPPRVPRARDGGGSAEGHVRALRLAVIAQPPRLDLARRVFQRLLDGACKGGAPVVDASLFEAACTVLIRAEAAAGRSPAADAATATKGTPGEEEASPAAPTGDGDGVASDAASGAGERCLTVLSEMTLRGIEPKPRTLSPVLPLLCERHPLQNALRFFAKKMVPTSACADTELLALAGAVARSTEGGVGEAEAGGMGVAAVRAVHAVLEGFWEQDFPGAFAPETLRAVNELWKQVPGGLSCSLEGVDAAAGALACRGCGAALDPRPISAEAKEGLAQMLLQLAAGVGELQHKHMGEFREMLRRRREAWAPFTFVVDGANVGYLNQNTSFGRFSFAQIDRMFRFLQSKGGDGEVSLLLVLPERYSFDVIPNHCMLTAAERD